MMVFPRAALQVTGDAAEHLRTADSGAAKRKVFCRQCGSPLYNKPESKPDLIGVYVGTLDDPSVFKPQIVMFASRGALMPLLRGSLLNTAGPSSTIGAVRRGLGISV